jgi:hypothetical protein
MSCRNHQAETPLFPGFSSYQPAANKKSGGQSTTASFLKHKQRVIFPFFCINNQSTLSSQFKNKG